MNVKVEKQPKSTLKLSVTVEVAKVKEAYEKILSDLVASTELPGFRNILHTSRKRKSHCTYFKSKSRNKRV